MADLKDLQEIVKNGEFSKQLLGDEEFKNEIKKILKEENGVEITDEDIPEVVEELAKSLTEKPNDSQVKQDLSETKLENVSGGVSKAKVIKGVSALAGSLIGARLGYKGGQKGAYTYLMKTNDTFQKAVYSMQTGNTVIFHPKKSILGDLEGTDQTLKNASIGGAAVGGVAGAGSGYWISNYLCNKFNIK